MKQQGTKGILVDGRWAAGTEFTMDIGYVLEPRLPPIRTGTAISPKTFSIPSATNQGKPRRVEHGKPNRKTQRGWRGARNKKRGC